MVGGWKKGLTFALQPKAQEDELGCNSWAETVVGFLSSGSASWMKPRVLKEIPDSPSLYPARPLEDPSSRG